MCNAGIVNVKIDLEIHAHLKKLWKPPSLCYISLGHFNIPQRFHLFCSFRLAVMLIRDQLVFVQLCAA